MSAKKALLGRSGQDVRREAIMHEAAERGFLGAKGKQMGGRFSEVLIDEAKRVSGISENTDLLTYALAKVVIEDDFAEKAIARRGRVPKGTLSAG